jgi:regulator of sigma E protease
MFLIHIPFYIVSFTLMISVIVFIHEFGHYIVAKWAGVKIDTFSIGFGRELWGWNDASGTRWRISMLPFGGYVKMYGDASEVSTPAESISLLTDEEKGKTFHYKPLYKKAAIVVAGPLFNFILAIVIFSAAFMAHKIASSEPVIGQVLKNTPAEAAGLKPDDRILRIGDDNVTTFFDISRLLITNLGTPVTLEVQRGNAIMHVTLKPEIKTDKDALGNPYEHPIIGIQSKQMEYKRVGPLKAIELGTREVYYRCVITLQVIGQMVSGERSTRAIKGPIGLIQISGQAASHGIGTVILIMGLISANLGLVNLFPIPMLDGGHLLFYAIEAVKGSPPGKRFQEYSMRVGMSVIAMLMTFALLNDIRNMLLSSVGHSLN